MLNSIFNYFYQFLDSFTFLILAVAGLSIIFGMMGIINLAHGEFIMLGSYAFTILAKASVPLVLSVLLAAVFVGIFGYLVDRLVVSRLYGRPLDSVVATWGISLLLRQGILILMGPSLPGLTTPLGTFTIGQSTYSVYRLLLAAVAIAVLIGMYVLFMHTPFGLHSRATMQEQAVAQSLGVNTRQMYSITFMLGSALAGLCGALYAPTMTITPTMGQAFQNDSFVTVIVGGADPLVGMALSGGVLGIIQSMLSLLFGTFFGKMGLLVVAILVIRILPKGFSGLVEKHLVKGRR
ncbi:MAG: branched-chain amino acid ABC transporter permease [Anaerotruncus sp.]|nr:branched-chain amino acid ABC transporter permease [Anaerotruncus sp.]